MAKRKIASALVMHDETPRGRLFHVGFDWQYRAAHAPLDAVIDRYLGITSEDIRAVLAEDPFSKLTVVSFGPTRDIQ